MIETVLYRLVIIGVLMLMSFFAGVAVGCQSIEKRWQEDRIQLLEKARLAEADMAQQQDEVVREYTQKLSDMEQRYAEDIESIKSAQLRDTVPVPECLQSESKDNSDKRLPAKTENKSGVTCYTESELRAKIESSLALARECDKEMMRFQALVNACQK